MLGDADSVDAAVLQIQKLNPDLVFLDIEMPKANGFQLLERFKDFRFEVIFVTAYNNYAIKAIRLSAADYILKPINLNDLQTAVSKVAERIQQKQVIAYEKTDGGILQLSNGDNVPISRGRKEDVQKMLKVR